jgi:predicted small secreted protein
MNLQRIVLLLSTLGVVGSTALLTGCNTIEGAGRDVEAVGDAIEDAADDAND